MPSARSFYVKINAIIALTEPSACLIGVDSSQPINNYTLSMGILFNKEVDRLFGGTAAGRNDVVGWMRNPKGKVVARSWFDPKAGAQVATFVSPTNTKVYKAAQLSDPSQYSPAYVMLQDAQQLADRLAGGDKDVYPWMVDEAQQIIEIARGMYDIFGKAIF